MGKLTASPNFPLQINTLTGWAVDAANVPIQAGNFRPVANVYAISNFLPSSFVLHNFFWYLIVRNQILYRNMYLAASPDEILMASLQISLDHV